MLLFKKANNHQLTLYENNPFIKNPAAIFLYILLYRLQR